MTGDPSRRRWGPAGSTAPADAWQSYSALQKIQLLRDLAAGQALHLDRPRLLGYSRNMERLLYRRAADVAAILRQYAPPVGDSAGVPWRWADLNAAQQAQRLLAISHWARWSWATPDYSLATTRPFRELATAATVMADRLDGRMRSGGRSLFDGR